MLLSRLVEPFRVIYANRIFLRHSVLAEIKEKNAGSALGNWWLILSPFIFLSIYSVVYLFIFRFSPANMSRNEYVLHIFSGLVPFLALSEALSFGTLSLGNNRNLLKTTLFPIEIIPVRTVLATLPTFLIGMAFLFLGCLWDRKLHFTAFLVPLVFAAQLLFVTGAVWILSLVSLTLKDIKYLLNYLIMVLMLLSPIAYVIDMIPPKLRVLVWLNPFAYFIVSYQSLIVGGELPPKEIAAGVFLFSLASFLLGHLFFSKLKSIIINYA